MLIYTHENPVVVANVQNLLTMAGIEVLLKNQFASGGVGELAAVDAWPELWLVNERQAEKAQQIIANAKRQGQREDWFCPHCKEQNGAAFEVCWQCETPFPE
ncbi:DUF2007 domain-containing protein [Thalassotalea euphylliae]|uniref:DUF2007 domain-containing protein n=1 Tax=Thalassotalea euphylliae TaxID=1655234 RepID=A0A3E0TRX3_9GAMM|nr:DUF2007 domain-containing protein [Thalassotalea euphylliae]REL27234.1 DUF2007 domain-containing protein [Thalassotalea euphylliae]